MRMRRGLRDRQHTTRAGLLWDAHCWRMRALSTSGGPPGCSLRCCMMGMLRGFGQQPACMLHRWLRRAGPVATGLIRSGGDAPAYRQALVPHAPAPACMRVSSHGLSGQNSLCLCECMHAGWVREMYAWDLAIAMHKNDIHATVTQHPPNSMLIIQPPFDTVMGNASIFHYTWGPYYYDTTQNKTLIYKWEKREMSSIDVVLKVGGCAAGGGPLCAPACHAPWW